MLNEELEEATNESETKTFIISFYSGLRVNNDHKFETFENFMIALWTVQMWSRGRF